MFYSKLVVFVLNFFDHFQQKKVIKFLKKNFKSEIILYDVGSHYGETVKLFLNNFKIKELHCFEASSLNFEILIKNLKKINIKVNHQLNNFGLGSINEDTFINQTKESSSSTINDLNLNSKYLQKKLKVLNLKNIDKFYQKLPVKIITLDKYILEKKQKNIDVLKIDTEGFELEVLYGAKSLLKNNKCFCQIEIREDNFNDVAIFFKNLNYDLISLNKNNKTDFLFSNFINKSIEI